MSDNITRISLATALDGDRTDWTRVERLSDAAITNAMASDPDSFGLDRRARSRRGFAYVILRDAVDGYRWQLQAPDGHVVARSAGAFGSLEEVRSSLREMQAAAAEAEIQAA